MYGFAALEELDGRSNSCTGMGRFHSINQSQHQMIIRNAVKRTMSTGNGQKIPPISSELNNKCCEFY